LGRRLRPLGKSASAALESLSTCHLNHYAAKDGPGPYAVTELDAEQREILEAMRLLYLADDDAFAEKIHPRRVVVPTTRRRPVQNKAAREEGGQVGGHGLGLGLGLEATDSTAPG